jgi:radical SAM protein with 4Fe4S-binding SPASM domain
MSNIAIKIFTPIKVEQQKKIKISPTLNRIIENSDEIISIKVTIENNSTTPILASEISNIFLCYQLINGTQETPGQRTPIKSDISINSAVTLSIQINLNDLEGDFLLKPCLVQENISWLNDIKTKTIPLQVQPATIKDDAKLAQNRPIVTSKIPFIFNFELTNKCPFSCIMCARTNNMTRPEGIMSLELFKRIIDELVAIKASKEEPMWLHGFGESLSHPEFDKFISYASQQGFNTGLSVNPFMLTNKVATRLLVSEPKNLYLAIDGHDNQSFEEIRGLKNAYDKSIVRLEKFIDLKNKLSPKTKLEIGMIDFELNQESINQMKKKWQNFDPSIKFVAKTFTTWDGSAEDINKLKLNSGPKNIKVTCQYPWTKMTVNWDGKVSPCCFDYNKKHVLGDLNTHSIVDIWNSEKMQELRAEFKSNKVKNSLCKNCENL